MKKIITLFLLVSTLPAFATVPKQISVQGVLRDNNGQLVSGTHILKLNLYDALTGGTQLYSDIESVTLANGVYTAFLGNQIALPDSLAFDRAYYLGIAIDNGAELSPRMLLTPVPTAFYAMRAAISDSSRVAASATPSGTATGDLSGKYPAPTVSAIASYPVSSAAPTLGQTLTWNGSAWAPSSGSAVAFSVIGGTFQSLPHDVTSTIDYTNNSSSGAFDDGHYFSLDSDWFTPPVDGYYFLDAFISLDTRSSPPSEVYMYFSVNGGTSSYRRYYSLVNGGYTQLDYTMTMKLKAGDHVGVKCDPTGNGATTMGGNSYGVVTFSGYKIN